MTNSVTDLASRRPVTRTPEQIAQQRITDAVALIDNYNREGKLAGLMFIGLAREGNHMMGVAGQEDVKVLDMLSMLELHRQSILIAHGYDKTGSPEPEQADLFRG